jgi:hypothetical protein
MSISKTINEADKNLNAPRLDGPEIGDLCDSQQAYLTLFTAYSSNLLTAFKPHILH